ncbi:MAG: WD40/YVTN/BNR-like repeat-containing protein [Ilumatobacteraceae bacterium]
MPKRSKTGTSKKLIGIILAFVVIGGGVFLLTPQSNSDDNDSSSNALTPETSITHGHGLAIDVQDPSKLYIATHEGLLVLINDKDLYRVGKSTDDYMGFSPHPTDANILFSSGHPSGGGNIGFQKSEDGGFTWKKISNGVNGPVDFHVMAVSPVNPNLIYGWNQGDLQRSTDQGENWEIVNSDLLPIYLVADTQDENTVYIATTDGQGVMVSRDKGATWAPLSPELEGGAVSVVAIRPQDSTTLLTFSETLGGLGKSTDAGKTWKKVSEGFNGEVLLQIVFSRLDPNIVYALTHENSLYKSTDAGDTWSQIR